MSTQGTKHDQGKPRMELLPPEALEEIAKVLGFGASKYSPDNWRKGFEYRRLLGAALRHITAYNGGEDKDPESGLSHLAHASCCLMFLITQEKNKTGTDDRYKKELLGSSEQLKDPNNELSGNSRELKEFDNNHLQFATSGRDPWKDEYNTKL